MASPRPDPLRAIDRVLAPATWLVAALTLVVLLAGPELVGAKKPDWAASRPKGEAVFASAGCGGCHTLAAAGSSGTAGPNLDERKPDAATVEAVVSGGRGGMPSFKGQLYDAEIEAVARYVADNAGR